ncbi:hypothetical protein [Ornithinimicrobium kibberense]|uniref:hypothetical protein n=1 Tax=Ornithinimicrobium kibberense TaxID=282060 RepID=UPI003609C72F
MAASWRPPSLGARASISSTLFIAPTPCRDGAGGVGHLPGTATLRPDDAGVDAAHEIRPPARTTRRTPTRCGGGPSAT